MKNLSVKFFSGFEMPCLVFQVWDIPWYDDDDCIWVWDLTAPMHLDLINGPFVPHIKIKGAL
jgi:hypothetical protein